MTTYDPLRSEPPARRGLFAKIPPPPPGFVHVVERPGRPLRVLLSRPGSSAAAAVPWVGAFTLHTVDIREHRLAFVHGVEHRDAHGLEAHVVYTVRVHAPAVIVQRAVHDVGRILEPALTETLRLTLAGVDVQNHQRAAHVAAEAVLRREERPAGRHDDAFVITGFAVVLHRVTPQDPRDGPDEDGGPNVLGSRPVPRPAPSPAPRPAPAPRQGSEPLPPTSSPPGNLSAPPPAPRPTESSGERERLALWRSLQQLRKELEARRSDVVSEPVGTRPDADRLAERMRHLLDAAQAEDGEWSEQARAELGRLIHELNGRPRAQAVPRWHEELLGAEPDQAWSRAPDDAKATARGPSDQPTAPEPRRWFTALLEDHPADEPLTAGEPCTIAFGVDVSERADAVGQAPITVPVSTLFEPGEHVVELTVQVDSDDFDVSDRERPLRLRRTGVSLNRARFDVVPRHDGHCTLTATFHRGGNFVHQMLLTFPVGTAATGGVAVEQSGRLATAAAGLHERDLTLVITPDGAGYQCVSIGTRAAPARLVITPQLLATAVDELRAKLLDVVQVVHDGEYVFQTRVDIPAEAEAAALRTMARAGARLFQQIFRGPAAGADARALGDWLREAGDGDWPSLTVQVVSTGVPIPWSLLYLGDVSSGAELSWDRFLGMRHLVEQIPYIGTPSHDTAVVTSHPRLAVSINVNTTIDTAMSSTFVADQQQWWTAASQVAGTRLAVAARTTTAEFLQALADPATSDQILYFYGHATSASLTARGGPDASALVLSDGRLTLEDLNLDAPDDVQLPGKPLVVLNACESADLSPLFYDGFVPYFLAKGARGVVGTEAKTPAMFATHWATEFFGRLLAGQTIGQAVLQLRREFVERHRNPLGLLYAVHCDQDTRIVPPLRRPPA